MVNSINSYSSSAYMGILNTKSIASIKSDTTTILGYKVDKDGYFTEEFNKVAGIPSDYKIYAKGAENLVSYISAHPVTHTNIDFAKSLGNVYKLFSQIAPQTDSTSFSKEQISALPVGFEYDPTSFKVTKTYSYEEMQKLQNYTSTETQFTQIFPSQAGTNAFLQGKPSEDIFQSNPYINIGANAYKNADGSIEKGGALMAFFSARIGQFEGSFLEGETTIRGKLAGFDASMSQEQLDDLQKFIEQNPIQYGSTYDLTARFRLYDSNLSVEDFKTEWLKLKEQSNKMQANSTTQTAQNANANSNANDIQNTTNSTNDTQENTKQNTIKKHSPIQVTSKSEIYKDENLSRLQNILKNQHKFDLINILFGTNSNTSAFNANGTDLNTNLMNLNLSQIKPLSKVDIKA